MAYIGTPVQQALTKVTSQSFNGTGSQTVFTLNRAVNTGEELEVFVNNVQQEPGVGKSYTATGTTLTFDAAPASGTGNIYVIYRGLAEVTRRLEHDPNAALAATTGTFSGDLTVDTNTLYVDSTNNLVGVGITSPEARLDVLGNSDVTAALKIGPNANFGHHFYDSSTSGDLVIKREVSGVQTETMRLARSGGYVTMPYQPAFEAGSVDGQVLGSSWQTVSYPNFVNQRGSSYNASTSRFTAPISGWYQFNASWTATSNSDADGTFSISINGLTGDLIGSVSMPDTGTLRGHSVSGCAYLAAGDYAQVIRYSTVSTTTRGAVYYSGNFSGYLIG